MSICQSIKLLYTAYLHFKSKVMNGSNFNQSIKYQPTNQPSRQVPANQSKRYASRSFYVISAHFDVEMPALEAMISLMWSSTSLTCSVSKHSSTILSSVTDTTTSSCWKMSCSLKAWVPYKHHYSSVPSLIISLACSTCFNASSRSSCIFRAYR